ncbi:MAG TPA: hypothetical protein VFM32_11320 [Spongiibacteraceae bacterium]|nr:hypothetical protein [Spongiibacteraceae bacterium]
MSVSSVGSSAVASAQQAIGQLESKEVGPDHDGDADDAASKAPAAPATPPSTVNYLGQAIGATISTKA